MDRSNHFRDGTPCDPRRAVYLVLQHQAEDVSDRALDRLRSLADRYPSAVPPSVLDQLEQIRRDPDGERRRMVRLTAGPDRVAVRAGDRRAQQSEACVLDRSAGGLRLWMTRPVDAGAVLGVRLPGDDGRPAWFMVQVKYCRPEGDGWAAGCEYLVDRPRA